MRNLLAVLMLMSLPWFAYAQETKPIQLADYVSFCLALWAGSPDIEAKANALGLQSPLPGNASITIGKSTLRFFKSGKENQTVAAVTTIFADGKESSCDINNPGVHAERSDLESMAQVLDLDGQILQMGPATIGYWKMRDRRPPVLLKVIVGSRVVTLNVLKFEAAARRNTGADGTNDRDQANPASGR